MQNLKMVQLVNPVMICGALNTRLNTMTSRNERKLDLVLVPSPGLIIATEYKNGRPGKQISIPLASVAYFESEEPAPEADEPEPAEDELGFPSPPTQPDAPRALEAEALREAIAGLPPVLAREDDTKVFRKVDGKIIEMSREISRLK